MGGSRNNVHRKEVSRTAAQVQKKQTLNIIVQRFEPNLKGNAVDHKPKNKMKKGRTHASPSPLIKEQVCFRSSL